MSLALIVDVGTTNVKVGLVDPGGEIVARMSQAITPHRPARGAFEHSPDDLLQSISELAREVTRPHRESIAFVGLSGYQFGFLPLDTAGRPLTGMMTLLDDRPKGVMEQVRSELPTEEIYRRTGCPPLFTYALSKLRWLQAEKPDLFAQAARFADLKSFLLEAWTGQFVTEPSMASATQLLNIHHSDWDDEILEWIGIDRSQLPKVVPGDEFVGELTTAAAERLGVKPHIPVLPGLYDGGAMILGMGGYGEDVAVCNLGTTAMIRGCATEPLLDDPAKMRLQTYALLPGFWVVGGALNNAGVALRWYRDTLDANASYETILDQADQIEPGSEGLFCLPFLTGERDPRIGDLASGVYFGLKEFHTRAHMVRSILEGVAYGLNMVREAAAENGFCPDRLRIGGSGAQSDLWAAMLANVLNIPVERTRTPDATLIGASMLGFSASDTYDTLRHASDSMVKIGDQFSPTAGTVETYRRGYAFFTRLVAAMTDIYTLHAKAFP